MSLAKIRAGLIGVALWCALLAAVVGVPGVGTGNASAYYYDWYQGVVNNGSRVIGPYLYLYGVGWTTALAQGGGDNVCIGAKVSSDGLGANAIPFLCTSVGAYETRWTPGGQSSYGYPTAVANSDPDGWIFGGGVANRR